MAALAVLLFSDSWAAERTVGPVRVLRGRVAVRCDDSADHETDDKLYYQSRIRDREPGDVHGDLDRHREHEQEDDPFGKTQSFPAVRRHPVLQHTRYEPGEYRDSADPVDDARANSA